MKDWNYGCLLALGYLLIFWGIFFLVVSRVII